MQVKNLEVDEIILTKLDSKTKKLTLQINFINDSALTIETNIEDDYELLIDKILKQIKSLKKPKTSDADDFLARIAILNIKNEEDIKEKAPKRISMIDRKLDNFKQTKNYKEYMTMYSQFSTHQETIYKKGNSE